MSNIYYDQINRMAEANWKGLKHYSGKPNVSMANWKEWREHWFAIAEDWASYLKDKGEDIDADRVNKIIIANS